MEVDSSDPTAGEWLDDDNDPDNPSETHPPLEYNKNSYISGPKRVQNGSLPMNTLRFDYSYGYDCQRYFNLCIPDPTTLIFSSGAFIHFFDVKTSQLTFQRCSTGIGIGHIVKNPQECHIAVGETGDKPPIIIYKWPGMDIVRILQNGTEKNYSHLAYSPDGKLLLSQGSSPDYFLTIWNWIKSTPMLRCKSYEQDIYNAIFSPTIPGHLVTSGSGHIKCWKISKTFTGLKLEGVLGKFGKTEISDIVGLYSMPDEKVISGCEWGNILVWEEGVIKLEVRRKNNRSCHSKMITQFEYSNGDLISIGMDGWLRVWSYETIDQTDASQDRGFIEIEPINEFEINLEKNYVDSSPTSSMLMALEKKYPTDEQDKEWYGQDGNGGLWLIDLSMFDETLTNNHKKSTNSTRQLLRCHAGPIMDMTACTWNCLIATIGSDCHLHVYNYAERKLVASYRFSDGGTTAVWLPCSLDKRGSTIVCGFQSGLIRVVTVEFYDNEENPTHIELIQVVKPHIDEITSIITNSSTKLLITGSKDSTVFVFSIEIRDESVHLTSIGFIEIPSAVTCLIFKPRNLLTILIGCEESHFGEIQLPQKFPLNNDKRKTYQLENYRAKFLKFKSIKSSLKREILRQEFEKKQMEKREEIRKKIEEYRSLNPGIHVDEETFLEDTDETLQLPDLYVPKKPNPVQNINYTNEGTIWLSVGGYDAGYVYEYSSITFDDIDDHHSLIQEVEPLKATPLPDANDLELKCSLPHKGQFIFLGLEYGELRLCRVNPKDYTNFSDYLSYPMHDYYHGSMKKILLSHDQQHLFTCGYDGNLFSFLVNFHGDSAEETNKFETNDKYRMRGKKQVEDIKDVDHPSLEQVIITTECNRIMSLTKKNKDDMYYLLRNLTKDYQTIMERNKQLIKSQHIPPSNFKVDDRIVDDLNGQLQREMDLINQKMAFKIEKNQLILRKLMDHFVRPITCLPFAVARISKPDTMVYSLKEKKLNENFHIEYAKVLQKLSQAKDSDSEYQFSHRSFLNLVFIIVFCLISSRDMVFNQSTLVEEMGDDEVKDTSKKEEEAKLKTDGVASLLENHNFSSNEQQPTVEMKQMLRKYKDKKLQIEKRSKEWKIMHDSKPNPNVDHPDDIQMIEIAKKTIGDYKLKISSNYNIENQHEQETTLSKYKQLLDCRKKSHYLRESFNDKLRSIRDKKLSLKNDVENSVGKKLSGIHAELPNNYIRDMPEMPAIDISLEYPENNLKLEKYISMSEKVKEARRQKQSIIDETMEQAFDEEFKTIVPDESLFEHYSDVLPTSVKANDKKRIKEVDVSIPKHLQKMMEDSDRLITPWEREMRAVRLSKKLYEQDCIIRDVQSRYEDIDRELDELESTRLQVYADSVYADLYKLTLHQELIVLRDSERTENSLREKVNEKLQEKAMAVDNLQTTMRIIDKKTRDIKTIQNTMKEQSAYFANMIQDNKYCKFLTRIFKKKIKSDAAERADNSSQASSDSSDVTSSDQDDSDNSSVDIHKIVLTTFDENICPPDCSRELYNLAFEMRLKRHDNENEMREEQKNMENLVREADNCSKKIKIIVGAVNNCTQKLNDFMDEKQRKLNDIDMTLILNFHQLEHFIDDNNLSKINDCVVFDTTRLSQLYKRVGELQQETCEQKIKHKKNCTHLHRMNIDCKYMDSQIKKLKSSIEEEMIKKFGCQISLVSLYEAVVRSLINSSKGNRTDDSKYEKQLKCLKERYDENTLILENLIRDNTEKLSVLTVLTEEQIKFHNIIKQRPESSKNIFQSQLEWRKDLAHLQGIISYQKEQKEFFRSDVRNLKLKIRTLPPITSRRKYFSSVTKIYNKRDDERVVSVKNDTCQEGKMTVADNFEDKIHDSAFRIVRNLLSQIIEQYLQREEAASIVDQFCNEISNKHLNISTVFIDSFMDMCEKIEKRIEDISTKTGIAGKIREIILEYGSEIISQLEIESRGIGIGSVEISWNVKPKLDEFLESMDIRKDIATEVYIMKFLKMEMGLELAADYILTKLPSKPDSETAIAFREYTLRTLTEIQRHIEGESETETTIKSSNSEL
ncbi:LOW QUALITY PROTEIN: cilia- and flagella-associated protein 44 [Diachasmimorpha longicaudata]|uniref:LOW QUALITY PROTEIN: cilia- and flagella-associated protein 44 n=1 Tax=Diachasmimorpha longicaudata TaxID=58733 RepID=UPI0030B8886F